MNLSSEHLGRAGEKNVGLKRRKGKEEGRER